jgi:hypothetical protein
MSDNRFLDRIVRECGGEGILEALAERLEPTDLQTLLLEVFSRRSSRVSASKLLDRYENDRFSRPSQVDPRNFNTLDSLAFSIAAPTFEPIELSPVSPLGTCSAVATVSQNNVVSTARNNEVVSDCTNVMALECAMRRKRGHREPIHLCCSHRLLRSQQLKNAKEFASFRVFSLCSAGRDIGSFHFERDSLLLHISFYLRLLTELSAQCAPIASLIVKLAPLGTNAEEVVADTATVLQSQFSDFAVVLDRERKTGINYYETACFGISVSDSEGQELNLADGGFVDWTKTLLSNKKERLIVSGIGTERLCALLT